MLALSRFFAESGNVKRLLDVLDGNSTVSLRLLDYFVTNFARKHKTTICNHENAAVICVHSHYRSQLKAFSKQQFDPFRRRERIFFSVSPCQTIETTVGQLNFFRWAIESGVLQYVIDNKSVIERDMCNTGTDAKHYDKLSDAPSTGINQLHVTTLVHPQVISFD